MHRHFVATEILEQPRITLDHADSRHFLNVLRLKKGDEVQLFDGKGAEANCLIAEAVRGCVTLDREGDVVRHSPPPCRLVLGACVSKGKRMEWTIEKAVELGVSVIIPIASQFSVVRLEKDDHEDKRERWRRIAIDAARQCDTPFVPEILEPQTFGQAMDLVSGIDAVFAGALQPDAVPMRDSIAALRTTDREIRSVAWLVGPEGDFSPGEYAEMRTRDIRFVSLGNLILRTETAAIYGLCVLGCEFLVQGIGIRGNLLT